MTAPPFAPKPEPAWHPAPFTGLTYTTSPIVSTANYTNAATVTSAP